LQAAKLQAASCKLQAATLQAASQVCDPEMPVNRYPLFNLALPLAAPE